MSMDFGFDFGFNFDDDMDLAPVSKTEKKSEKKAEKNASSGSKKSTKKKENAAKGVKLSAPVTIWGRNFKYTVETGEKLTLQSVAETLYQAGYPEVAHKDVSFAALGEHLVILKYNLTATESDAAVSCPVKVADGMQISEYSASDFEVDEEDISVAELQKLGLNHLLYADMKLSYDQDAGVALPIYKEEIKELQTINTVSALGLTNTVSGDMDVKKLAEEYIGELPDGVSAKLEKSGLDGTAFLYAVPSSAVKAVTIDRSFAGIEDTTAATKKVEESIYLPVTVHISNWGEKIEITPDMMGGAEKVKKPELIEKLKELYIELRAADRKIDSIYCRETNRFSIALVSGTKGSGCVIDTPVFSVRDGEFSYKLPVIPLEIMWQISNYFKEDLSRESIVQVWYHEDTGYRVVKPVSQDTSRVHVSYAFDMLKESMDDSVLVMTVHSHNTMKAFFSPVDDKDELYMRGLYGVFGELDIYRNHAKFRYTDGKGYAAEIRLDQVMEVN